jgi:hypothetical protein
VIVRNDKNPYVPLNDGLGYGTRTGTQDIVSYESGRDSRTLGSAKRHSGHNPDFLVIASLRF